MALIVVNLTDTFDEWRTKTNSSIAQIGDLSSLATANQASIVAALNGMMENVIDAGYSRVVGEKHLKIYIRQKGKSEIYDGIKKVTDISSYSSDSAERITKEELKEKILELELI